MFYVEALDDIRINVVILKNVSYTDSSSSWKISILNHLRKFLFDSIFKFNPESYIIHHLTKILFFLSAH